MTRKLLLAIVGVCLGVGLLLAGWLGYAYWSLERSLQEGVRTLKGSVTRDLLDPDSARFRSLELWGGGFRRERVLLLAHPSTYQMWITKPELIRGRQSSVLEALLTFDVRDMVLCGEVNAKNQFGAYAGFRQFYVSGDFGNPILDNDSGKAATTICTSIREASPPMRMDDDHR